MLDTNYRNPGASPDGLASDIMGDPQLGLLEVKYPYSPYQKSLSVEEASCQIKGWQIQGQLAISCLPWCNFFVWIDKSVFFGACRSGPELLVDHYASKVTVLLHLIGNAVLEGCWPSCCALTCTGRCTCCTITNTR